MKNFLAFFFIASLVLVSTSAYAVVVTCETGNIRYEVMGDGTIQDCRTGLIWLQNAKCTDNLGLPGIDLTSGTLTWNDALRWVAALSSGYCGLTDGSSAGDWRLPTKTEWMAMVAYARKVLYTDPALTNAAGTAQWTADGDAFNNVFSDVGPLPIYWSSNAYAGDASRAWYIDLHDGVLYNDNKTVTVYFWPVRGGQSGAFGDLTIQ